MTENFGFQSQKTLCGAVSRYSLSGCRKESGKDDVDINDDGDDDSDSGGDSGGDNDNDGDNVNDINSSGNTDDDSGDVDDTK